MRIADVFAGMGIMSLIPAVVMAGTGLLIPMIWIAFGGVGIGFIGAALIVVGHLLDIKKIRNKRKT